MKGAARILVTGAGGFVGGWLVDLLAPRLSPQDAVVAVCREGRASSPASVDITKRADVDALVGRIRPSCIVHLAAMSSPIKSRQHTREAWDVNLYGTLNLAEATMKHVPEARFIFASSSEIYGTSFNAIEGLLDETALLAPRNPYAATKAAADLLLGQMAEAGLRAVRFRPFNHTGPGQSTEFAIPAFAAQIASIERGEQEAVLHVGNLDASRDFLDVRDVVSAYIAAVLAEDFPSDAVFNVASGIPRRIGAVLDGLLALSQVAIRVEHDAALMRPSDLPVTGGDARRARDVLEWQPTIPWKTTLRDVLDSHRRLPGR